MNLNHASRYLRVFVSLALLIVLFISGLGKAVGQAVITVSETELKFSGMTDEALQRSLLC